jgi:hypothetical protein
VDLDIVGVPPAGAYETRLVLAADVDLDGRADLVIGEDDLWENDPDSLHVIRNLGGADFLIAESCVVPPSTPWGEPKLSQLLAGDLDRDGFADLMWCEFHYAGPGLVQVLRNDRVGGFVSLPEAYLEPSEDPVVSVHDFDGDGLPDLAAFSPYSDEGVSRLAVHRNLGGGRFESPDGGVPALWHGLPHYAVSLAFADLDLDTRPDLLVGYRGYSYPYPSGVGTMLNLLRDYPTPVEISLGIATVENGRVRLSWRVSSPQPVQATVCRRAGEGAWRDLASVVSDAEGRIAYLDAGVMAGERYRFRLRYTIDDRTAYSDEVEAVIPVLEFALRGGTPNPSHGELLVRFSLPSNGPATLELLDLGGRRVGGAAIESAPPGPRTARFAPGRALPAGVYWLRLVHAGRSAFAKVVILR